jgi:hypothetical protein
MFKPHLCPSIHKMGEALGMLSYFLPCFIPATDPEFIHFIQFILELYNSWNNQPAWESVSLLKAKAI